MFEPAAGDDGSASRRQQSATSNEGGDFSTGHVLWRGRCPCATTKMVNDRAEEEHGYDFCHSRMAKHVLVNESETRLGAHMQMEDQAQGLKSAASEKWQYSKV